MGNRGFWSGLLMGGIVAAALTWMYMASPQQRENQVRRISGRIREAGQLIHKAGGQ